MFFKKKNFYYFCKKNNNNVWAGVFLFVVIVLSISCKKADENTISIGGAPSLEASMLFTQKPNEDHVTDYAFENNQYKTDEAALNVAIKGCHDAAYYEEDLRRRSGISSFGEHLKLRFNDKKIEYTCEEFWNLLYHGKDKPSLNKRDDSCQKNMENDKDSMDLRTKNPNSKGRNK